MLSEVHPDVDAKELFTGPGEMRALCRAKDWSATPFGPVNQWPTSLRTLAATLLASRHPMFLWWGPELAQLYNDAYRPSFGHGDRHPRALGMRGKESWPEIWHIIGPQIDQIMGGGEATWHEDQLVPIERNGRLEDVWWTYSFGPAFDDAGAVAGVLVVCQETTTRVLTEHRLEQAALEAEGSRRRIHALQALTAALAESWTMSEMADAIAEHATAVLSAVGVIIARVSANGEHLEVVGAHPPLVEESWRIFQTAADVPLADCFRTGEPVYLRSRDEWRERYPKLLALLDATGHEANIVLPLVVNNEVVGVMGAAFAEAQTFSDEDREIALAVARQCSQALDRAHLFESERKARAIAESANRVKADFLASMSHEFRTPLNAIAGYAQLLELGIYGPVNAEQLGALSRIQRSEAHLLSLVNDVLNFAKIEAGRVEYDMAVVDLADAIAEVTAMVEPQLAAKGLVCDATVPHGILVRADREKLQQILLNLLSNSMKFTSSGGRITIQEMRREGMPPSHVFLRITDTGIGIRRNDHASVFEPFVQVRRSRTDLTQGTGLGLAISRDLARGMGGDLRVRSEEGHGSAFTLTLDRG